MTKKVKAEWTDKWTGETPPPVPVKLHFTYNEHTYGGEICEGQENDAWPCYEDQETEFSLYRCNLTSDKAAWMKEVVEVDFAAPVGSNVWVVIVRYSTGGTFGRTNGCWSFHGVFNNLEEAKKVEASIYDGSYPGYKCWVGYFESLEGVEITQLTVEA